MEEEEKEEEEEGLEPGCGPGRFECFCGEYCCMVMLLFSVAWVL